MQTKDIDTIDFLNAINIISEIKGGDYSRGKQRWVMRWELETFLNFKYPEVNWKLTLSKARNLMKKGLLEGCDCGCRGDFYLTPAGYEKVTVWVLYNSRPPQLVPVVRENL